MPPIEGRLIQTWMYERTHLDDNHYSHPIDFVPLVDLNLKKVSPTAGRRPCLFSLGACMHDAYIVMDDAFIFGTACMSLCSLPGELAPPSAVQQLGKLPVTPQQWQQEQDFIYAGCTYVPKLSSAYDAPKEWWVSRWCR